MSQVYEWFNYDKKERLDWWWSTGGKLWGSNWTKCDENNALLTLLADRWKGDRIIRYGCEGLDYPLNKEDYPFIQEIQNVDVESRFYESANITGLFEETEGQDSNDRDENGNEIVFCGPFELQLEWYRYVVNLDRKVFFDRERSAVKSVHNGEVYREDLFTVLCTPYGSERIDGEGDVGSWFSERIVASNSRPDESYSDITSLFSEDAQPTNLTDVEILAYVKDGAPDMNMHSMDWDVYANEKLDELLRLEAENKLSFDELGNLIAKSN